MLTDTLLEKNLLPDAFIRQGIRRLLHQRLRDYPQGDSIQAGDGKRQRRLRRRAG